MSLFFATHDCTQICEDLNLERFDLSGLEVQRLTETCSRSSTSTEVKHSDLASYVCCVSPPSWEFCGS